jgi:hypothetical protein
VFLIASGAQALAKGTVPSAKKMREKQSRRIFALKGFPRRQDVMKTIQESKTVAPIFIGRWTLKVLFSLKEKPYRHGQLRRHVGSGSQREARDEVESHCGGVFLDANGKDTHRSAQSYVPLGKTIPQGRDCEVYLSQAHPAQ